MSAKHDPNSIERCACGRLPANRVHVSGDVRTFWIECMCGARTEAAGNYDDALYDWNRGAVRLMTAEVPGKPMRMEDRG